MRLVAFTYAFLFGCAAFIEAARPPTVPYSTESNTSEPSSGWVSHHWSSQEGSIVKSVTLHNPTAERRLLRLFCAGEEQLSMWVDGRWKEYAFVTVPARYRVGDACAVE